MAKSKRRARRETKSSGPERIVPFANYATRVLAQAKPATATASPSLVPSVDRSVSEEQVRRHAYLNWEAAGRPPGDGVNFWLVAEHDLLQRLAP